MSDLVPNLDRLREALPETSPMHELLAAFEVRSATAAEAEVHRVAVSWEATPAGRSGQATS